MWTLIGIYAFLAVFAVVMYIIARRVHGEAAGSFWQWLRRAAFGANGRPDALHNAAPERPVAGNHDSVVAVLEDLYAEFAQEARNIRLDTSRQLEQLRTEMDGAIARVEARLDELERIHDHRPELERVKAELQDLKQLWQSQVSVSRPVLDGPVSVEPAGLSEESHSAAAATDSSSTQAATLGAPDRASHGRSTSVPDDDVELEGTAVLNEQMYLAILDELYSGATPEAVARRLGVALAEVMRVQRILNSPSPLD